MTVTKHSGQPGNALALDEKGKCEIVALSTASTAVSISTADSGKLFILGEFATTSGGGGGPTITLPAVGDGLNYEFYVAGGLTSGAISFAAAATGTMVVYNDVAADSVNIGKATGASVIGGAVRFVSNGTKWYSIMEPAFTSAAPTTGTMTEFGFVS